MKRYTFLLLAFFLANTVHADGIMSGIGMNVSAAPNAVASVNQKAASTTSIKKSSSRNTSEVSNTLEPKVTGDEANRTTRVTKTMKTSSSGASCKTYEGKTYEQGEAGYSDCMRNIRTDRQGTRTVP